MPIRQNRTSAFFRRFAGPKSLTLHRTLDAAERVPPPELKTWSIASQQLYRFAWGRLIVDALVFEFMGLAMLALCVIVVAIPSARRPSGRHVSDF